MIIEDIDIDGFKFVNIGGEVNIVRHDKKEIEIECKDEDKLVVHEKEGIIHIMHNQGEFKEIRRSFINRIFNKSLKLNIPFYSSYIDNNNDITIYNQLTTHITIYVPYDIVEYIYIDGNLHLYGDDFTSFLKIYAKGNNKIDIDNIKNVYVDGLGQTECLLNDCCNISMYFNGKTYVKINSKFITNLYLKSKGELNAHVFGKVNDFSCDVVGVSTIDILGEVTSKRVKRAGLSKITIQS